MDPLPGLSPEVQQRVDQCQQLIQYTFRNPALLLSALTHASGAQHRLASNERLEFLGDSILGTIVCEYLFHNYPNLLEGHLTKIKSVVVSRQTCAKISRALGLESQLIVGKGISTDKPVPHSLLADVFESMVAAVYLDGGMEVAREFVERCTIPEIELAASGNADDNFKSLLQQIVQRDFSDTPSYTLIAERGPDHDKWFCVAARFNSQTFPVAWGRNKKEAEQRAACNALASLSGQLPPFVDPPELLQTPTIAGLPELNATEEELASDGEMEAPSSDARDLTDEPSTVVSPAELSSGDPKSRDPMRGVRTSGDDIRTERSAMDSMPEKRSAHPQPDVPFSPSSLDPESQPSE